MVFTVKSGEITHSTNTRYVLMALFVFLAIVQSAAQHPGWSNYTDGHNVTAISINGNDIWAGTGGGLVKINKITGETVFYNHASSGLPDNAIKCLAMDSSKNVWAGTKEGLVKFDGVNWTMYDTANSKLRHNNINCITADTIGGVWVVSNGESVININGTEWKMFSKTTPGFPDVYEEDQDPRRCTGCLTENPSTLPENSIFNIAIDKSGVLWVFTYLDDIVRYDGTKWSEYDLDPYGFECNNDVISRSKKPISRP